MAAPNLPDEARDAARLRQRREIDDLDYRRAVRRLGGTYSQRQIGRWLGIAQPSVQKTLQVAAKDPAPVEGFSGATPYEICQRYAAGFMQREQLVDELTHFPYAEGDTTDGYDSLTLDPIGAWSEVSAAVRRGLIEDDVYEDVFNRRHGL